jgi:rare lipoprotein A
VGSNSGRRRHPQSPLALRWILIAAAGVAVVAIAVTVFAFNGSGGGGATQSKDIADLAPPPAPSSAPRTPDVSRAATRVPLAMTVPIMIRKSGAPTVRKTPAASVVSSGTCEASYYFGVPYHGSDLVSAHKTLPFGTRVRVTNENNGESVVVQISDRGPYVAGRCLDLSNAAMQAIGGMGSGVVPVRYEVLA